MNCPNCSATLQTTCTCDVTVEQVITHSNLTYLLHETKTWRIPTNLLAPIRQTYKEKLQQLVLEMNPPATVLSEDEVQTLQMQLQEVTAQLQALQQWNSKGWLHKGALTEQFDELRVQKAQLQAQLQDHAKEGVELTQEQQLAQERRLLKMAFGLLQNKAFKPYGFQIARRQINQRIADLQAGVQPNPARKLAWSPPEKRGEKSQPAMSSMEVVAHQVADPPLIEKEPPPPPREPFTWDSLVDMLLSERTLKAVLFLGVLLSLASAVSWVAINWGDFTPLVQVGFLSAFTGLFYAGGWYVRHKMGLQESGMALTAVGALLVPLDFLLFYWSGGFGGLTFATVWLIGSVTCLGAYVVTAFSTRSPLFMYLVAGALGSLLTAVLHLLNVQIWWWQVGLVALGLVAAIVTNQIGVRRPSWQPFLTPWVHTALLTTQATMWVGLIWFEHPWVLALTWWLGAFTMLAVLPHYKMRTLVIGTVLAFPAAAMMTTWALLLPIGWWGAGWLLLAPLYLLWAEKVANMENEVVFDTRSLIIKIGWALLAIAAFLSLTSLESAVVVQPILAVQMVAFAILYAQPRLLWLFSLFSLSSVTAWQGQAGADLAELGLSWSLLSIVHVAGGSAIGAWRVKDSQYATPLFKGGLILAGMALLPPLILGNQGVLRYGLFNWIGLNVWLAYLAYQQTAGLPARRGGVLFHWLTAVGSLGWLWLLWGGTGDSLPLAYTGLAWVLLFVGLRVRRLNWFYWQSWYVMAHVSVVLGFAIVPWMYDGWWLTGALLSGAGWYAVATAVSPTYKQTTLLLAGTALALAVFVFGLTLPIPIDYASMIVAGLILLYVGISIALEWSGAFAKESFGVLFPLATVLFLFQLLFSALYVFGEPDSTLVWSAVSLVGTAVAVSWYAVWRTNRLQAHNSLWLAGLGLLLFVAQYSRGSGRSALVLAIAAVCALMAERWLFWAARLPLKKFDLAPQIRYLWRLYRKPLLMAAWVGAGLTIFAALIRNMAWLGGGTTRQIWSISALWVVVLVYALSAYWHKSNSFYWLASFWAIAPYALMADLLWPAWLVQSLIGLGLVGLVVAYWLKEKGTPTHVVAHGLVAVMLVVHGATMNWDTSVLWLGVGFYATAVTFDYLRNPETPNARFWYPTLGLLPLALVYTLDSVGMVVNPQLVGVTLLALVLPLLVVGWVWADVRPAYRWPFYLLGYGLSVVGVGMLSLAEPQLWLAGGLLFNALVYSLSAVVGNKPRWLYPALVCLPVGLHLWLETWANYRDYHTGWMLILLAGGSLAIGELLKEANRPRFSKPLVVGLFPTLIIGQWLSIYFDSEILVIGFGLAALVWVATAVLRRTPYLLNIAIPTSFIAYVAFLVGLDSITVVVGRFMMWPFVLALFVLGWGIETFLPKRSGEPMEKFPWDARWLWWPAFKERFLNWWGFPLYGWGLGLVFVAVLFSVRSPDYWLVFSMSLAIAVYTWSLFRFRNRWLLVMAWGWMQLTAVTLIGALSLDLTMEQFFLLFVPVNMLALGLGLLIQHERDEPSPLGGGMRQLWRGWSRPFFAYLALNMVVAELFLFAPRDLNYGLVTLCHAVMVGVVATFWRSRETAYVSLGLGVMAVGRFALWLDVEVTTIPVIMALLVVLYGAVGYGMSYLQRMELWGWDRGAVWERPLRHTAWGLSCLVLLATFVLGDSAINHAVMTMMGSRTMLSALIVAQTSMIIQIFAILGLFYLTIAVVEQSRHLGYGSMMLVLVAWSFWLFILQGMTELQLFVLPAGMYLLSMGWLEWEFGNRSMARWLDRVALVLLLGTAFWQSFGHLGGLYALLMIGEGIVLVLVGGVRRLRRLLYAGVAGVVMSIAGQLVAPLLELNTYIYLLLGVILLVLGIGLEQRREKFVQAAHTLLAKLEDWE